MRRAMVVFPVSMAPMSITEATSASCCAIS